MTYYREQRNADGTTSGWEPRRAAKYQYAIPVSGETDRFRTETVSQVMVEDYPSRLEIHKVEDGDSMVGNQNVLQLSLIHIYQIYMQKSGNPCCFKNSQGQDDSVVLHCNG